MKRAKDVYGAVSTRLMTVVTLVESNDVDGVDVQNRSECAKEGKRKRMWNDAEEASKRKTQTINSVSRIRIFLSVYHLTRWQLEIIINGKCAAS